MNSEKCKHCGGEVTVGEQVCSHCGMPLPEDLGKHSQRKFIIFFVVLVIFCFAMAAWLPPDWTRFMNR